MAWRTTEQEVRDLLTDSDEDIRMEPFIRLASRLVDKVSSNDSGSLLSSDDLTDLEAVVAAHFYSIADPSTREEAAGKAKDIWDIGLGNKGLEETKWGRQALVLDVTGYLATISEGVRMGTLFWGGLPPSEQTDYLDRD